MGQNAPPMVIVQWEDSAQPISAWQLASEFSDYSPHICTSVGWLVHDGEDTKGVAANIAEFGTEDFQMSGLIRIPTRCVLSVTKLATPCDGQKPGEPAK